MNPVRLLMALAAALLAAGPAAADPAVTRLIDDEIAAGLRAAGVAQAGRADDATLLRRIYLDLLGRPPTADEADAFLTDPAADKVPRLIRRLRTYPETAIHWRRVIAGWLQAGDADRAGATDILAYLGRAVLDNRGWDQMARELLDPPASGPNGAGAYLTGLLTRADPRAGREAAAVAVASGLFGAQIQCARCHDHPDVPEWTKARFDGLATALRDPEVERLVRRFSDAKDPAEPKGGKKPPRPTFLDGTPLDPGAPRAALVKHALRPDAPHFKRAAVNRVWKQLMGRGLVEPVDLMHAGNPGSHPALLQALADDFAANGFNFDRLVASIMHSEAYLRSARWTGPADQRPAPELFAVAELRPLSGPQTAWAVAVATGYAGELAARYPARGPGLPVEARLAWEQGADFGRILSTFRTGPGPASTARQALYLTFDPFVAALLSPAGKGLVPDLAARPDDEAVARRAYLAVLNRRPTPDEVATVKEHLKAAKTRAAGCQDLAWALIAGAEFRFNH